VALAGRIHHQQIPIGELQRKGLLSSLAWAKAKIPRHAEAEGGDRRLIVEFRFVIGMPAHAISAVAVAVQQQAVEAHPQLIQQQLTQLAELGCPGMNGLLQAAVAVGAARVCHPAGESWRAVLFAVHSHQRLLPPQAIA